MCICTDDKGIFGKGLSEEYGVLRDVFKMGDEECFEVARGAIDIIFGGEDVKKILRERFDHWSD